MKIQIAFLVCAVAAPLLVPVAAHAQSFKLLHSFGTGTDGALPGNVGLLNVNGTLYGTTEEGGGSNKGTIFAIDPANGDETVLYAFAGGSDGDGPVSGLLNVGGILYGTTSGQLAGDNGTVFRFDLSTGKETVLHAFSGSDGSNPNSALIKAGRFLYGTTAGGGKCSAGTVFKINPVTGAESVTHSFCGSSDGASPYADLLDVGGILYGTTYMGGIANQGTVFTVNTKTGAEAVLHSFYGGGGDGRQPLAALINVAGTLYGTTTNGGPSDAGTVFSMDPATGTDKILYSFSGGADGGYPEAALLTIKGTLYGSTLRGGTSSVGTIFKLDPASDKESVLHTFSSSNGAVVHGSVIKVGTSLYGTAQYGGTNNEGTVFSVKP
jgi:uncharacterized repeat protein (TIGR03803 family)